MPAFSFGRTPIEVCLYGRFSFYSLLLFFYLEPKRNATRVREWERGKMEVPRELPPIQSLFSSGFDASSKLMSNQAFFMTICDAASVVIQTCQRGNLPYVFYDVYSVIGSAGCGRKLFLSHHYGFHPAETEGDGVGGSPGRINSSRNGRCLRLFFEDFRGGWSTSSALVILSLLLFHPTRDFSAGKLLCFWKSVVSHWSVEGRPQCAQPPTVMASNCLKRETESRVLRTKL